MFKCSVCFRPYFCEVLKEEEKVWGDKLQKIVTFPRVPMIGEYIKLKELDLYYLVRDVIIFEKGHNHDAQILVNKN